MPEKKFYFTAGKTVLVILMIMTALCGKGFAQDTEKIQSQLTTVKSIRLGPHPEFTRLLINLNKLTEYQVEADFVNKEVTLILQNVQAESGVRSKSYRDKNLKQVSVRKLLGSLYIVLKVNRPNTRFLHYLNSEPPQIVVDLKSLDRPYIKTKIGEGRGSGSLPEKPKPEKPKKKTRIKGLTPEQISDLVIKNEKDKIKDGWEDYQKVLKVYQEKKYPEAVKEFQKFIKQYPESKYLSDIFYLNAEAEFQIAYREINPIYERPLDAYKWAIRTYPKSKFLDHVLYKLAFIYDELGYIIEARNLYEDTIKSNPKSIYNPSRKKGLALMLMKEERFEEALIAFSKILGKTPKSIEAKTAFFDVAGIYFDQKDFNRALKIYEESADRWPTELNERPDVNFNMGEIYFRQKKYSKARKRYFNLINLAPDDDSAHLALNRIGDSYLVEGKHLNALAVFNQSAQQAPEGRESQYGTIRMADIGVRNPRLPIQDITFDKAHYYQPFKTYNRIFKEAKDVEILAEVTLSQGIAFLKEQNYLKAIQQFKKLLPLGTDTRFYREGKKFLHQALILLIDRYSQQKGALPILYSFNDFTNLSIGKINNLKTLLQIGEAYQTIGMQTEAVKFYERVKKNDSKGIYDDRIFINLGRIHLSKGNYRESELVARSFLKNHPRSDLLPDAIKLLADSFKKSKQYGKALTEYRKLLAQTTKDPSEIHFLIAEVYDSQNNLPEAIKSYRKTLASFDRKQKIVPKYVQDTYYKLGVALYNSQSNQEAADALSSATLLFPEHPMRSWADFLLAETYRTMKENSRATEKLNRLAQSDQGDDLIKKAAASKLKVLDWEKQFKDIL